MSKVDATINIKVTNLGELTKLEKRIKKIQGNVNVGQSPEIKALQLENKELKENIELSLAGLDVINDLRPVTYNWKKAKDVQKDLPQYKDSNEPVLGTKYGERLHGFIAQEVKEVIDNHDELKDGFKMWKLKDDGTQTVADGNLIPILVKAVQELSTEINNLKQQLKDK